MQCDLLFHSRTTYSPEHANERYNLFDLHIRADLDPNWIRNTAKIFDVCVVES